MADEIDTAIFPVVEERLVAGKRTVDDGVVRVRTVVDARETMVRGDLLHGRVEIERVALNIEIDAVPPVRDEGDSIVVPAVREALVVIRRLILTEKVRLRRVSTTEAFSQPVILHSQRAVIERDVTDATQKSRTLPRSDTMSRTLTAMFDSRAEADAAKARLLHAHVDAERIQIVDRGSPGTINTAGTRDEGFWASLKNLFLADDDRTAYGEGIRRGGVLLTADVEESEADQAVSILDDAGSVDFDARQEDWRREGWSGGPLTEVSAMSDAGTAATDRVLP